jgi:hypothetical protein
MELHNMVTKTDHQGKELQIAIGIKKKIVAKQKKNLSRIDLEMRQQGLDIKAFKT